MHFKSYTFHDEDMECCFEPRVASVDPLRLHFCQQPPTNQRTDKCGMRKWKNHTPTDYSQWVCDFSISYQVPSSRVRQLSQSCSSKHSVVMVEGYTRLGSVALQS